MTPDLLHCDVRSEGFKGTCHLALGMGAAVIGAYNVGAAIVRPSPRLAAQAVFYVALAIWEGRQAHGHWSGR